MVVSKPWLPAEPRLPARPQASLGILAFEAAAAMSRLLSLHRALSDAELAKLRSDAMRAPGVAYLNSTDQSFLLRLACAELIVALDAAAATVARISARSGFDFAGLYANLKAGVADRRIEPLAAKGLKVKAKKMERLVAATAKLCAEMEALEELEATERRLALRGWTRFSGPIPAKPMPVASEPIGSDSFRLELKSKQLRVRRLKEESLWSHSFDKVAGLTACAACAVFIRICTVFGPFVPGLPLPPVVGADRAHARFKLWPYPRMAQTKCSSGPIERRHVERMQAPTSNSCPIFGARPLNQKPDTDWKRTLEAAAGTVGAAGLELQYANVIVSAEMLLQMEVDGRQDEAAAERKEMYEMLPVKLRGAVRAKLRDWWRDPGPLDTGLAEGWKEAVGRILGWLGPMARDTIRWQSERNMDRQKRFDSSTRAFALQTLRWSDKEKAEAAIVEVLVGLSCVCWYEERRQGSLRF